MMEGGNIFLDPNFQIKENCHVRFLNLPADLSLKQSFPSNCDINKFIQIKGNYCCTNMKIIIFIYY